MLDRACILLSGRGAGRTPARSSLPSSFLQDPLKDLPILDTLLDMLTEVFAICTVVYTFLVLLC